VRLQLQWQHGHDFPARDMDDPDIPSFSIAHGRICDV